MALHCIVIRLGMRAMKNWARTVTLIFVLLSAMVRLVHFPTPFDLLRVAVDVAILVYLLLPDVKRACGLRRSAPPATG